MEPGEMGAFFANGSITYVDRDDASAELPWNPHPAFKGVSLKPLIKGADTGGAMSCSLVRLEPAAVLETHVHENQAELHEVIDGGGTLVLDSKERPYHPGRMGLIPKGTRHRVVAGKDGLFLLAVFFPALA